MANPISLGHYNSLRFRIQDGVIEPCHADLREVIPWTLSKRVTMDLSDRVAATIATRIRVLVMDATVLLYR